MNILDRLPVPEMETDIVGPDGAPLLGPDDLPLVAKQYQIIAWASLSSKEAIHWDPGLLRFPVVVDTGLNHNLAMTQDQWDFWSGLTAVPSGVRIEFGNRILFPRAVQVWIHRNEPGRETLSATAPFRLRTPEGVIVYPFGIANPARLPTLGLRAILRNKLTLVVDGQSNAVTLSKLP